MLTHDIVTILGPYRFKHAIFYCTYLQNVCVNRSVIPIYFNYRDDVIGSALFTTLAIDVDPSEHHTDNSGFCVSPGLNFTGHGGCCQPTNLDHRL